MSSFEWHCLKLGNPNQPALVLLHGFASSHTAWQYYLEALSGDYYCLAYDLPGHGKSLGNYESLSSLNQVAESLAEDIHRTVSTKYSIIGYSLGARVAMHVMLNDSDRIDRSILISGSPGIPHESEREQRRHTDDELAGKIIENGMLWFGKYWSALPIFASRNQSKRVDQSLMLREWMAQDPHGLAHALRILSPGRQEYLLPRLSERNQRQLWLAGILDSKYASQLALVETAIPNSVCKIIPDAGHDVIREQPEAVLASIQHFLAH